MIEGQVKIRVCPTYMAGKILSCNFRDYLYYNTREIQNISTSPLAPASEFLKKGLSGKYILVFPCPNGQADFLKTKHISFTVNGPNTQEYSNNSTTLKRKWFSNLQILDKQYMPLPAYVITYFGPVKNYFGQVKTINHLPSMAS